MNKHLTKCPQLIAEAEGEATASHLYHSYLQDYVDNQASERQARLARRRPMKSCECITMLEHRFCEVILADINWHEPIVIVSVPSINGRSVWKHVRFTTLSGSPVVAEVCVGDFYRCSGGTAAWHRIQKLRTVEREVGAIRPPALFLQPQPPPSPRPAPVVNPAGPEPVFPLVSSPANGSSTARVSRFASCLFLTLAEFSRRLS